MVKHELEVLKGLSLEIGKTNTSPDGPSGSGKSTLMNIIRLPRHRHVRQIHPERPGRGEMEDNALADVRNPNRLRLPAIQPPTPVTRSRKRSPTPGLCRYVEKLGSKKRCMCWVWSTWLTAATTNPMSSAGSVAARRLPCAGQRSFADPPMNQPVTSTPAPPTRSWKSSVKSMAREYRSAGDPRRRYCQPCPPGDPPARWPH